MTTSTTSLSGGARAPGAGVCSSKVKGFRLSFVAPSNAADLEARLRELLLGSTPHEPDELGDFDTRGDDREGHAGAGRNLGVGLRIGLGDDAGRALAHLPNASPAPGALDTTTETAFPG